MAMNATRYGTTLQDDPCSSSDHSTEGITAAPHRFCPISDERWGHVEEAMGLSPRELQIIRLVFDAKSEAEIARDLDISIHTVHSHFVRLYRKLGVHDRCELVLRVFGAHCAGCSLLMCNQG